MSTLFLIIKIFFINLATETFLNTTWKIDKRNIKEENIMYIYRRKIIFAICYICRKENKENLEEKNILFFPKSTANISSQEKYIIGIFSYDIFLSAEKNVYFPPLKLSILVVFCT